PCGSRRSFGGRGRRAWALLGKWRCQVEIVADGRQNPRMREIKHSALIGRPQRAVFEIINDIEKYPEFLPWCTHAKVQSRSDQEIVATVGVRKGPLQGEFTTRNELEPDRRITMRLVSGPFRALEGEWLL